MEVPLTATVPWNLPADAPAGERRMGYIAGFDGIRAIAVLAVLLFHADLVGVPGGFLGVDVFFVLSGFLITSLLLQELARTGDVAFGRFYLGRARRLLPALVGVLFLSAVVCLTVARDAATQFTQHALASMTYVTNWYFIGQEQSYFEVMGRPPMLQHLWSLAVEEQFYLLWPLAAVLLYRWAGRRAVGWVALVTALVSAALMAVLSAGLPAGADASRLYFGTDTHCMGLLLGAALAAVWRPGRLSAQVTTPQRFGLWAGGIAGLAGLLVTFCAVAQDSGWLYRGGFLAVSVGATLVVAVACHPAVRFGNVLGTQPMRYIGERSYGLYLYHWPVFVVTRPELDIPLGGIAATGLRLLLTFAVAELSYRFLEMPVRRGTLLRMWRGWRDRAPALAAAGATAIALSAAVFVGGTAVAVSAVPPPGRDYLRGATAVGQSLAAEARRARRSAVSSTPDTTVVDPDDYTHGAVTAIGDSVMLGAREGLLRLLPRVSVDAAVSRDGPGVQREIEMRNAFGVTYPAVVIHTGTNGPADLGGLRAMLHSLRETQVVVFVTVRTPRWWMDESNRNIREAAAGSPKVRLADWERASAGHPEYLVADGTHLTDVGVRAYARVIKQALAGQAGD